MKKKEFPDEIVLNNKKVLYDKTFKEGYDVVLGCNDVLEFIKTMPHNMATLIVTSPPYNIGKPYEEVIGFKKYIKWQESIIRECVELLKPNGSICWEVGNYIEDMEVFPLDIYFYGILKKLGLKLRNRIIWYFGHGLHAKQRFSGRYEAILWFTKGNNYVFNLDDVRIPQKYPGKRGYKGPNNGKPTAHRLGKNPSDIWELLATDWEKTLWGIPNVKANHPEKTIHSCQFPIELVERLVLALTNEKDTVFDPFMGVGSSVIAALLHNRIGIGVDKERIYTDVAWHRVVQTLKGNLKKRTLGKPVYKPKGTEKVAMIPPEWKR